MAEGAAEEVVQLRRLSVGLVLGGASWWILAVVLPGLAVGGAVLALGTVVWIAETSRRPTAGVGTGIALVGVVGAVAVALSTGFSTTEIAVFAVAAGVINFLLAPTLGDDRGAGENAGDR